MRQGSSTRWGSRDAVLVASRVLAVVFAALVPAHLLALDGTPRLVMTALAGVTAVVFHVVGRRVLTVSDGAVDRLLVLVCLLPLANTMTHLAASHEIELTAVVALVVAGFGAVSSSRLSAWLLILGAWASWSAVVLVTGLGPGVQIRFWAAQLVLAGALSVAVLEIRLSAYRRLTRAILRSEFGLKRFRSVFDHSPVGIGLADEHGYFVEANAALCELLGRAPHEVLDRTTKDFAHPDDLPAHGLAGDLVRDTRTGTAQVEKRYVRPDGEVRWAWLSLTSVAGPGGETWTLAHMQDITERKKAEDELRLSRESMVAAVEIAQATQTGRDPRPVILHHLRRLAGASFVSLTEPLGDDRLVVTAVDGGLDLVGLSTSREEPSITTHVWSTGEPVFASQLTAHPLVSPQLLAYSNAASLMWQPVGTPGDPLAVLSIAWDDPLAGVDTAGRAAVEAVAAEAGAALTGEAMRRELERSTVTDTLTGLLNRRGWNTEVERVRAHTERTGVPFTLAVVDLDHFKRFNDTHGHLAGDEVLRAFAQRAKDALRVIDVVSRWGGEEFAVALHGTSGAEAVGALERLRGRTPDGLTCSIGYVEVRSGDDLQAALSRADAALYEAKRSGRDRVVAAKGPLRVAAQRA